MADEKDPLKPQPKAAKAHSNPEPAPLLSEEDKEGIRAEVRAQIAADKKKAALANFKKTETLRLQREEGLVTGSTVEDEMVNITLDLADHSGEISINGRKYFHGHVYTVARHIARTLSEIQMRGWDHENEVKSGKSRLHNMQNRHNSKVSPVGIFNPPRMSMA